MQSAHLARPRGAALRTARRAGLADGATAGCWGGRGGGCRYVPVHCASFTPPNYRIAVHTLAGSPAPCTVHRSPPCAAVSPYQHSGVIIPVPCRADRAGAFLGGGGAQAVHTVGASGARIHPSSHPSIHPCQPAWMHALRQHSQSVWQTVANWRQPMHACAHHPPNRPTAGDAGGVSAPLQHPIASAHAARQAAGE
jgi:hypothetical protein